MAYCEVHEVQDCLNYIRAYGTHLDLNTGHWDKAARVAMELLEHPALAIPQRLPALAVLALVRARRGDPGVDPLLDEAERLALPTSEFQSIGRAAAMRAEVAWYRGDLASVAATAALGLQAGDGLRDPYLQGDLASGGVGPMWRWKYLQISPSHRPHDRRRLEGCCCGLAASRRSL